MIKKKMTFKDFNGVERTMEFCFHITEAELMQMELETVGGYRGLLQRIIDANDQQSMIRIFKEFIDMAYGVLDAEGIHFRKSPEALAEFKATQAYSDLYMELISDDEKAINFLMAAAPSIPILPENKAEIEKELGVKIPDAMVQEAPTAVVDA